MRSSSAETANLGQLRAELQRRDNDLSQIGAVLQRRDNDLSQLRGELQRRDSDLAHFREELQRLVNIEELACNEAFESAQPADWKIGLPSAAVR